MDKKLKPVPADKQKSLGKLPTDVRNKMGYAQKGKMMKATKGKMMDKKNKSKKAGQVFIELKTPSFLKPKEKSKGGEMKKPMKAALGALALGAVGAKAAKKLMKKKASAVSPAMDYLGDTAKKSKGGEMKGYGAARTSGMGLQDENLIPGKSMDYIKDLI